MGQQSLGGYSGGSGMNIFGGGSSNRSSSSNMMMNLMMAQMMQQEDQDRFKQREAITRSLEAQGNQKIT